MFTFPIILNALFALLSILGLIIVVAIGPDNCSEEFLIIGSSGIVLLPISIYALIKLRNSHVESMAEREREEESERARKIRKVQQAELIKQQVKEGMVTVEDNIPSFKIIQTLKQIEGRYYLKTERINYFASPPQITKQSVSDEEYNFYINTPQPPPPFDAMTDMLSQSNAIGGNAVTNVVCKLEEFNEYDKYNATGFSGFKVSCTGQAIVVEKLS